LLQRFSKDEMVMTTAGRMLTSARWMSRMIANLLDLARARLAGGVPLNLEVVDASLLLERVMVELRPAHPDSRVDVRTLGNLKGEWDPDRLTQVLTNLVGNAMKHGDNSAPVEVVLDGSAAEEVSITVINLGTMPAIVLAHVFDPFRTGVEKPGRTDGLGLGMYISKQIVEAHRGRIAVESGRDNRTVVRVDLPRGQVDIESANGG
jgi:signal transduction histidine kinase